MISIIGRISLMLFTKIYHLFDLAGFFHLLRKNKLKIKATGLGILHEAMHLHDLWPIQQRSVLAYNWRRKPPDFPKTREIELALSRLQIHQRVESHDKTFFCGRTFSI